MSFWVIGHPYYGLYHDAIIYTFFAYQGLYPENFTRDLFLQYDSQSAFSLIIGPYREMIRMMGVEASLMILYAVTQILWVTVAYLFLRNFVTGPALRIALVVLCLMPRDYGVLGAFRFAESFMNARPFAEPAALLSILMVTRHRFVAAALLFLLATLLHPLIGVTTAFFGAVYLCLEDRRWLWAVAAGIAVLLALGLIGLPPFNSLFVRMDDLWLGITKWRSGWLFMAEAQPMDLTRLVFMTMLNVAAYTYLRDPVTRRLFLAALLTGWISIALNIVGGDLLGNHFILQTQSWRSLWILYMLAAPALGIMIMHLRDRPKGRLVLLVLLLAWVSLFFSPLSLGLVFIAFGVLALEHRGQLDTLSTRLLEPLLALFSILAIGFIFLTLSLVPIPEEIKDSGRVDMLFGAADLILLAPLGLILMELVYVRHCRKGWLPIAIMASLAVALGLFGMDRQPPHNRYLLNSTAADDYFRDQVPLKATVLWDAGAVGEIWFGVRRSNYLSRFNGAQMIFNREVALSYITRLKIIAPLLREDPMTLKKDKTDAWYFDPDNFKRSLPDVCRAPGHPDFIVTTIHAPDFSPEAWSPSEDRWSFETTEIPTFFLYDCTHH